MKSIVTSIGRDPGSSSLHIFTARVAVSQTHERVDETVLCADALKGNDAVVRVDSVVEHQNWCPYAKITLREHYDKNNTSTALAHAE